MLPFPEPTCESFWPLSATPSTGLWSLGFSAGASKETIRIPPGKGGGGLQGPALSRAAMIRPFSNIVVAQKNPGSKTKQKNYGDYADEACPGGARQQQRVGPQRSEERRVGKECRSRWGPEH